ALDKERLKEYRETLDTNYAQTTALIKLNELIDPSSYVVTSAGALPGDMHRVWKPGVENTYHAEYGYSAMGYEIAGSLGVKLAHPDKEVYSMVGDGSFLMLHTELIKLNELIDPSSYVVTSAGALPGDMHRVWKPGVENTYHAEYGYSAMGYEIAGSLGVKLAHPDKEVYSMVGDGSFLMLHTEL